MAGNARGKLKEHTEGIHRNFDWVVVHCNAAINLMGEHHPELQKAFKQLATATQQLDELTKSIYQKI